MVSKKYSVGMEEKYNQARSRIVELEVTLAEIKSELGKRSQEVELALSTRNKVVAAYENQKTELAAKCTKVET